MRSTALEQLRQGLALLAKSPDHFVRRCLVHHEPLDEELQCPKCPVSQEPLRGPRRGRPRGTFVTVRWEVFDKETGEVVGLVLGDFRIEWHEEPSEDRVNVAGRDRTGCAKRRGGYRRNVGRRWEVPAWAPYENRVEPITGRPNRKKRATAA
jgi:hypothetical protein